MLQSPWPLSRPLPRPGEPHHDFELKVAARKCSCGPAGSKVCSSPPTGNSESFSPWNSESPDLGRAVYADTRGLSCHLPPQVRLPPLFMR